MKMMGEEEKIALMKKKLSWEKREKEQESNRQKKEDYVRGGRKLELSRSKRRTNSWEARGEGSEQLGRDGEKDGEGSMNNGEVREEPLEGGVSNP